MIYLIIKSYLIILSSIAIGAVFIFSIGVYFILKSNKPNKKLNEQEKMNKPAIQTTAQQRNLLISSQDIYAIAGDDTNDTQLDLARAFIETGKKQSASKILNDVAKKGSGKQKEEAKHLLKYI